VREVLSPYDLMIVLGADPLRMSVYSEVDPLPDGLGMCRSAWSTGTSPRITARDRAQGDVKGNLRADSGAEAAGGGALERAPAGLARWREELDREAQGRDQQISKASSKSPIDPDWLALQMVEAMPTTRSWSTRV